MCHELTRLRDATLSRDVCFFRDTNEALRHVRDHLLTHPECSAWSMIFALLEPEGETAWVAGVGALDARQRQKLSRQLHDDPREAQALYESYARAADAALRGWRAQVEDVGAALSPLGVLVFLEGIPAASHHRRPTRISTAYLPGKGTPHDGQRHDGPLLHRESPLSEDGRPDGRYARRGEMRRRRRERAHALRELPPEQRIFHDIFKVAVRALQGRVLNPPMSADRYAQRNHRLNEALFDALPGQGRLSFEAWREQLDRTLAEPLPRAS